MSANPNPMTPEQEQECLKLKELFLAYKKEHKITQKAFSEKFDLGNPSNLNQYFQCRRPLGLSFAIKVANALGVEVKEFSPRLASELKSVPMKNVHPVVGKMKKIPIIGKVHAGLLNSAGQIQDPEELIDKGEFTFVDEEMPDGTFAYIIEGQSMEPEFREGDMLIVDPTIKVRPGDFVIAEKIALHIEDPEWTFKKYKLIGIDDRGNDVFDLVPLNSDYPIIHSTKQPVRIIGTVVEHRRNLRYR